MTAASRNDINPHAVRAENHVENKTGMADEEPRPVPSKGWPDASPVRFIMVLEMVYLSLSGTS